MSLAVADRLASSLAVADRRARLAYRDAVLGVPGVFAYWRLGEKNGVVAADELGVRNGTYVNTPTLGVAGPLASTDADTAVTFAVAQNEYVDVGMLGNYGSLIGAGIGVEFWLKTVETNQIRQVIHVLNAGNSIAFAVELNRGMVDNLMHPGLTSLYLRSTDGKAFHVHTDAPIYDGAWHHVVYIADNPAAGVARCYVDGLPVALAVNQNQGPTLWGNFLHPLGLAGNNNRAASPSGALNGSLDEFVLWTRPPTAAEVALRYLIGKAGDKGARPVASAGLASSLVASDAEL